MAASSTYATNLPDTSGLAPRADHPNVETLSAAKVMTELDREVQVLTPTGASRDCTMYAATSLNKGRTHWFYNGAASALDVVLKQAAGTTIITLGQSQSAALVSNGSTWSIQQRGASTLSASVDTISEVTSGVGVTIDSLLIKDGDILIADSDKIQFGTPGTDVVFTADGTDMVVTATGDVVFADSVDLKIGTGKDLGLVHDGTNSTISNAVGDLIIDNTDTNDQIILRVGTNTSATGVEIRSDADTVHFSVNGAGTVTQGVDMWVACPSDPNSVHTIRFFEDFVRDDIGATGWVVTEDDAADTQVVNDAVGGTLTLTCKATTDNDACQVIWAQETFELTSGKKLWFEARIKSASGDMTNSDWFVGLAEAEDLTGVADNMPANGLGFHKEDGAATFSASNSDNGTNQESAAVGTIVDATYIRIGLLFDGGASGAATLTPYINGTAGAAVAAVTYTTQAEMAPIFMVRNGDATTTQTLVIDYVKVVQER